MLTRHNFRGKKSKFLKEKTTVKPRYLRKWETGFSSPNREVLGKEKEENQEIRAGRPGAENQGTQQHRLCLKEEPLAENRGVCGQQCCNILCLNITRISPPSPRISD